MNPTATLPILDPADPCRDCGACCTSMVWPPFYHTDDPEWDRIVAERPDLVAGIEADRTRRKATGAPDYGTPCSWYDVETRRCRHYEYRPGICIDFEPGEEGCLDARERAGFGGGMEAETARPPKP